MASHTSIFLNWSFWTAVAAFVAIVLSQLPPVHQLVRPAKLALDVYSRIHLTHKVGNPNAQLHLILTNTGGRVIKIKKLTLIFLRDGKEVARLPAQNYLQQPSDQVPLLLTRFILSPNEEWAHITNFLKFFTRPEERKYRKAESEIRNDINTKIDQRKRQGKEATELIEADPQNVVPFNELFEEKFIWEPGEYELKIKIETEPEKAAVVKNYRFTLFESDAADLISAKDDYRYGDSITWDSKKHPGIIVNLAEQ